MFESASAFNSQDTVTDFTTAQSDKLNLHDIHLGSVHDAILDFLHLKTSDANTNVSVDIDGADTARTIANIATLAHVTGLKVTMLYNDGKT